MITRLTSIPLQSGAIVMATGIVAIGMFRLRVPVLADPLLAVAAAVWLLLGVAVGVRARVDSRKLRSELSSPGVMSWVAATAVLGAAAVGRGWTVLAACLLVLAAGLLIGLALPVLRRWQTPTRGISFLLAVAVASVSVLASELSRAARVGWLVVPAGACWALAVVAYLFVARRFDLGELLRGRGDHWVAGGALAIATLAGSELGLSLRTGGHPFSTPLEVAVTVLWAAASAWMGVLLLAELASWRVGYHHLRWATVFPIGMYGVCTLGLGTILRSAPLLTWGRVCVWIGFATWALLFIGLLTRHRGLVLSSHPVQDRGGG